MPTPKQDPQQDPQKAPAKKTEKPQLQKPTNVAEDDGAPDVGIILTFDTLNTPGAIKFEDDGGKLFYLDHKGRGVYILRPV